ncbi:MAG TPA: nucleotide sugar dehydrogenase [Gemmatimonadales bacterium]|nr:nucleotide sugar dehydrogenase [Gemmatimonadales bacterium]
MPLSFSPDGSAQWRVRKIAVVGPGIVGTPMAAMLAHARIRIGGNDPARVVVIQRASATSGWKVAAINEGRSPIGGVEPELDRLVSESVGAGLLSASHDPMEAADADVVLVCVQTDKRGSDPDYGPLFDALHSVASALAQRPAGNLPLVVIESTLAPSSMTTVVRKLFREHDLEEGRDVLLGNSPNRVMPGRLVERVSTSDKLVAGLDQRTPALVAELYRHIVTGGTVHPTSSLTAEIVKTLENAYRDVRIAFSAEICRWCDSNGVDFYALRNQVNSRLQQCDGASADPNAVPSGALLVPTVGVGGHCLPKDGVLLWWRRRQHGHDPRRSLILQSRRINDASPATVLEQLERNFGPLRGRRVALLGAAYRFNSEDTRNSPTLVLGQLLQGQGTLVRIHDPYVYATDQNLVRSGLGGCFTRELRDAVADAEILVFCTAHQDYITGIDALLGDAREAVGVYDGCNLFHADRFTERRLAYAGIGRGRILPTPEMVDFVTDGFRAVERGLAHELRTTIKFLNRQYGTSSFDSSSLEEVRRLAATCVTGCVIAETGPVFVPAPLDGFLPSLVRIASRPLDLGERASRAPSRRVGRTAEGQRENAAG